MPEAQFPIVYVRGYAGTQGEVESTVDDPYYGFNLGSTHVHPDGQGSAMFFAFESPIVRLMKDWGYRDVYSSGMQGSTRPGMRPPAPQSIWIFRYYDPTANTFTTPGGNRLTIEESAKRLGAFMADVQKQTGSEKIVLVAHSMGGLYVALSYKSTIRSGRSIRGR
jgi:hypothetical protein